MLSAEFSAAKFTESNAVVDTELGAKDLLNNRMAYVAVSRGALDAQLFTNDRDKLYLCCLFAPHTLTLPWYFAGAASAALYWTSLAFAQIFPGTAWHDPEFDAEVSHSLGLDPQQLLGYKRTHLAPLLKELLERYPEFRLQIDLRRWQSRHAVDRHAGR